MTGVGWDEMPGTVLVAGIPLDDGANRAHARKLGLTWIEYPAPAPRSTQAKCGCCDGGLLLDPDSSQLRGQAVAGGRTAVPVCLVCVVAMSASYATGLARPGDSFEQLRALLRRLPADPAAAARMRQGLTGAGTAGGPS